jgi:penicillin-binding protein 1A
MVVVTAAWCVVLCVVGTARCISIELDRAATLAEVVPRPQTTTVFDREGHPAFSFFVERRTDVPLDQVSPHMIAALLAIEDRRFFSHHGLDPVRMLSAAWHNMRAGRIIEGGSTITQQLARGAQLSPIRTYRRKIREVLLATRMEQRYSKAQILEQYLNAVYFGQGLYGVEAAAHGYFDKCASDLQPHEAALLAALVRSPSSDAPSVAPRRALERRNLVLRLMRRQWRLSDEQFRLATAERMPFRALPDASGSMMASGGPASGLYFQEEVRRQLVSLFGSDRVLGGGLRVYSTYDPARQLLAENAVTTRIAQIVKARPRAKDLQGSFVAMDPATGDVLALVGGRDYHASSFNRATQARRQAGSAFKPIVYAAALERGYSPGTLLRDLDAPIEGAAQPWLPSDTHERSEYTLRSALTLSSNRAAAQLLRQVGVTTAVYYAHRLGIESKLPMVPSLALGTGEVTLLELTTAYTAFANRGMTAAPRLITRVEDSRGTTIYEAPERHVQAISPTTAFLMSSMLSDVISRGTATGVRAAGFTLPAAGKTGTTDDYADAWFVGYTPHLVAGVWFGFDRPAPIMRGGYAGVVAVPAWGQFMRSATAGSKPDWYEMPAGVEKVAICRLSGLRATEGCWHASVDSLQSAVDGLPTVLNLPAQSPQPQVNVTATLRPGQSPVYVEFFPIGTLPNEVCPLHGAAAAVVTSGNTVPTQTVDGIPQQTPGSVPAPANDNQVVIERVVGADGVIRVVMRQRRQ